MKTTMVLSVAAAWMSLLGCGGDTGGGNGGGLGAGGGTGITGTPVAQTDFDMTFVSSVCDHVEPCCKSAGQTFDAATCRSNLAQTSLGITGNLPPGAMYDAQAAGDCIAEIQAALSTCSVGVLGTDGSACRRITVGTKAAGDPCVSSRECAAPAGGSAHCEGDGGTGATGGSAATSTCMVSPPKTRGTAGQPCDETCTEDVSTTSCSGFGSVGGSAGGAGGGQAPGSCYKNDGLICDTKSSTCVAAHGPGEACSYDECRADSYCNGGMCIARAAEGQPCALQGGEVGSCLDGLRCDGSTCVAGKENGAACESSSDCKSGRCDGKVCYDANSIATPDVCGTSTFGQPGNGAGGSG